MAAFAYRRVTQIRYEWVLHATDFAPWGAPVSEVDKILADARDYYREVTGREPDSDDWLRVRATDTEIIFFFQTQDE